MCPEIVEPRSDFFQAFYFSSPFPPEKPDTQAKFQLAIQSIYSMWNKHVINCC